MSILDRAQAGKITGADRELWYGERGVGKTTTACQYPNPLLLDPALGSKEVEMEDPDQKFRIAVDSWSDILDAAKALVEDSRGYRTLIIDELGEVERMMWEHICRRDGKKNIEAYGYGKGFTVAVDEWRRLCLQLTKLVNQGIGVILIGHSDVKHFKNPEGGDYDRYQIKMHPKGASVLTEYVDAVFFIRHEKYLIKHTSDDKRVVAKSGAVVVHTKGEAAFDAKNRWGMPEKVPFAYAELQVAKRGQDPRDLRAEVLDLLKGVEAEWVGKAIASAKRAKTAKKLLAIKNTVIERIGVQTTVSDGGDSDNT